MIDFSIISPIYNRTDLTLNFVKNVSQYLTNGELILVDNNSRDKLNPIILKNFLGDKCVLLNLDKNYGFGTANNRGAEIANGEFLCFVSNDVIMNENSFIKTIDILKNEDVLIGHRIIDFDSGWNTYQECGTIFYAEGYFLACRKQSFFDIGMFWEELFLDMEDVCLSYEWIKSGRRLKKLDSSIIHLGGQTAKDMPDGRLKITLESQEKFRGKYGWHK